MLKQQILLEVKINERDYRLVLPENCPLGEVHDALFQMRTFVFDKIKESLEQDKKKEDQAPTTEEVKG